MCDQHEQDQSESNADVEQINTRAPQSSEAVGGDLSIGPVVGLSRKVALGPMLRAKSGGGVTGTGLGLLACILS